MFLNADFRPGPAMALPVPVSFYGRFVLFRPLPSERVIKACVGSVTHRDTAFPRHCEHIGPHEQRAAIANLPE